MSLWTSFGDFRPKAAARWIAVADARLVRVVNTAIALKNLDPQDDTEEILDCEDGSASLNEFKLALAVLKELGVPVRFVLPLCVCVDSNRAGIVATAVAGANAEHLAKRNKRRPGVG
jgi:hypothetical protein